MQVVGWQPEISCIRTRTVQICLAEGPLVDHQGPLSSRSAPTSQEYLSVANPRPALIHGVPQPAVRVVPCLLNVHALLETVLQSISERVAGVFTGAFSLDDGHLGSQLILNQPDAHDEQVATNARFHLCCSGLCADHGPRVHCDACGRAALVFIACTRFGR